MVVVRSSHSCAKIPLTREWHTTIARETLQNVGVCERNSTHNYDVRIVASQEIRIILCVDGWEKSEGIVAAAARQLKRRMSTVQDQAECKI